MNLGLSGKVVVVTGGSKGIGLETAKLFGREGARVALTYNTDRDGAERVVENIRQLGGEAIAVQFKLGSVPSARATIESVFDQWHRIDVLVNNAVSWGYRTSAQSPPFEALRPAEWQEGLRANIEGAYATTQAVIPAMRANAWGRIVNVSSSVTGRGAAGTAWYTAAKAALHGLTRSLAPELGAAGILVNVVMPGLTVTPQTTERLPLEKREDVRRETPIGRLLEPADVAPAIVFLASEANTAITGEIVGVTGGWR